MKGETDFLLRNDLQNICLSPLSLASCRSSHAIITSTGTHLPHCVSDFGCTCAPDGASEIGKPRMRYILDRMRH